MSLLANSNAIESGGYPIQRSLRFRSSASAYLSRTFGAGGNVYTYSFSGWIKRGALGSQQGIFGVGTAAAGDTTWFGFTSTDNFILAFNDGTYFLQTTQVFRDPSAYYHVMFVVDTTQATASNRVKLFINGSQVTAFSTATYPLQNSGYQINGQFSHRIAARLRASSTDSYFDGYLAEVNFIDGQALTPSSFGQTDAGTGVWQPLKYMGTYGTNGFYLPFSDNTSATTLAYDKSGNGNNWTPNNISTTAGATYDSMTDVPTLTSATAANTATINPIYNNSQSYVSYANLRVSPNDNNWRANMSSIGVSSGKWYVEGTLTNQSTSGFCFFGIESAATIIANDNYVGGTSTSYGYRSNGETRNNSAVVNASYGASYTTGDVIGIALDMDAGTLVFYKNGTSQGTAFSSLSGTYLIGTSPAGSGTIVDMNFGQRPFSYTPPTGFKALNTFNLPDPTIKKPNQYMDATLFTGNASTNTITNSGGFQPDFVWSKSRSASQSHSLIDSVRGITKVLYSDATNAEDTFASMITSLNSNGVTYGSGNGVVNNNGITYVAWQWQAGKGTTSSNTSGSITSTVSVNPTAGFSVVTYTGTGANATVGHGLGVAPNMIFIKNRSAVGNWIVYHSSVGATQNLFLNTTAGSTTDATAFNNTSPTSSVFSIGTSSALNGSTNAIVAYCFSSVSGFSKFGSYVGNGSTDGPFIFTGFRPRFVLIKSTAGDNWTIVDTSRNTYNVADARLFPSTSGAEATGTANCDILSNGYKIRIGSTDTGANGSGTTYIYAAFAESPFKTSLAR